MEGSQQLWLHLHSSMSSGTPPLPTKCDRDEYVGCGIRSGHSLMLSMSRESTTERLCSSPAMARSKAFCFTILLHSWYFILASLSLGFTFTTWPGRGSEEVTLEGQPPSPDEPSGSLQLPGQHSLGLKKDRVRPPKGYHMLAGPPWTCHLGLSFYIPIQGTLNCPTGWF